jgi:hypothetical protein
MGHRLKQVVLSRDLLLVIEQGQLTARRMANLERPLVEITRPRPQPICTGAVPGTVNAMAPDTLRKIHALSSLDHIGRRLRSKRLGFEPFRRSLLGVSRYYCAAGKQHEPCRSEAEKGFGTRSFLHYHGLSLFALLVNN